MCFILAIITFFVLGWIFPNLWVIDKIIFSVLSLILWYPLCDKVPSMSNMIHRYRLENDSKYREKIDRRSEYDDIDDGPTQISSIDNDSDRDIVDEMFDIVITSDMDSFEEWCYREKGIDMKLIYTGDVYISDYEMEELKREYNDQKSFFDD